MYKMTVSPVAQKTAQEVLKGAYDLHIHSGPSAFPRRADDLQVLTEAEAAGMAGVGFKAHEGDTAIRAKILSGKSSSCKAYGGIVLNHFVGGINPAAAEASLKAGGTIIWLPTVSSQCHIKFYTSQGTNFLGGKFKYGAGEEVSVLTEEGKLVPAINDVFDLVSSSKAILSTGHLSPAESLIVARGFQDTKTTGHLVFGHPDLILNQASLEEQQEFARLGGYIEKCTLALHSAWGNIPIEEYVSGIKQIGIERCFLSTDAGGPERPSSPDTLSRFIGLTLEKKLLTEKELRIMLVDVPRMLLNE